METWWGSEMETWWGSELETRMWMKMKRSQKSSDKGCGGLGGRREGLMGTWESLRRSLEGL